VTVEQPNVEPPTTAIDRTQVKLQYVQYFRTIATKETKTAHGCALFNIYKGRGNQFDSKPTMFIPRSM